MISWDHSHCLTCCWPLSPTGKPTDSGQGCGEAAIHEVHAVLPAEGHSVLPEGLGLTLICLPPLLHVHTFPVPQGCDTLVLGHQEWGMQLAAQCLARGALSSVQAARPMGLGAQVVKLREESAALWTVQS